MHHNPLSPIPLDVCTRTGTDPGQDQPREIAEGKFVVSTGNHDELLGAVDALVPMPVTGVGAGERAQHLQPRHETQAGVRFSGRDKRVHLIDEGEVMPGLWRQRILAAWLFFLLGLHPRSGRNQNGRTLRNRRTHWFGV